MLNFVLKQILPQRWIAAIRAAKDVPRRLRVLERQALINAATVSRRAYPEALPGADDKSSFNRHEFKVYAQNGEDGLLLHVFECIGTTNRRFVEFGIGDGRECCTANLSINFGWGGLLMDCGENKIAGARAFYRRMLGERADGVTILNLMVTKDNINPVIEEHVPDGALDLLSIDIDGNDYWIWKAINVVKPRVVVIEYGAAFGYERAVTVAYDPAFSRWEKHPSGLYAGASLVALAKLGREKGYRLVGCNRDGVNAFFVREDCAVEALPELSPAEAYFPNDDPVLGLITPERFAEIQDMPVVEV